MGFLNRPSAGRMIRRSKRQAVRDWFLRRGVKMDDAFRATRNRDAHRETARRIGRGPGRGFTRSVVCPRKSKKPSAHKRHIARMKQRNQGGKARV